MRIVEIHIPDRPLEEHIGTGNEVPGSSAVSRLVDTDASFRVAGGVLFTSGGINSVAGRIRWIHQERANRIDAKTAGHKLPTRAIERLISAPNTAARCSDVKNALI